MDSDAQNAPQMPQQASVNVQSFMAKYKSKRECYNFLSVQVEVYLPAYETVTIYFLKDLISGKKKFVKAEKVRTICVPHYEGLSLADMSSQLLLHHQNIYTYFPDQQEIHKTPKQWIVNVCATVLGDVFVNWVKDQIEARNAKVTKEKDMLIAMDPDVAAAFQRSTAVSLSKGVGAQMLKVGSKRRRTKAQIKAEKEEEEQAQAEQALKLSEFDQLQHRLQQLENQVQSGKAASDLMSQFINAGVVKQTGDDTFIVNNAEGEQQF